MTTPTKPNEKMSTLVRALGAGCALSATDVSEMLGMSSSQAYALMTKLSHTIPLAVEGGRWRQFKRGNGTSKQDSDEPREVLTAEASKQEI